MDSILLAIFRVVHVVAGVFWAGSVYFSIIFMLPAVAATAPASGQVMGYIAGKRRFADVMLVTALLNIGTGLVMYFVQGHFGRFGSISTISITVGAIAALVALVYGLLVPGRAANRLSVIGGEVAASGGPPSPEQGAELAKQSAILAIGVRNNAILLTITIVGMEAATALVGLGG